MTYLIHADVKITRRKTMCIVYDANGQEVAVHRKLLNCLIWLHDNDIERCQIDNGLHRYSVTISPLLEASRPWTGDDIPH